MLQPPEQLFNLFNRFGVTFEGFGVNTRLKWGFLKTDFGYFKLIQMAFHFLFLFIFARGENHYGEAIVIAVLLHIFFAVINSLEIVIGLICKRRRFLIMTAEFINFFMNLFFILILFNFMKYKSEVIKEPKYNYQTFREAFPLNTINLLLMQKLDLTESLVGLALLNVSIITISLIVAVYPLAKIIYKRFRANNENIESNEHESNDSNENNVYREILERAIRPPQIPHVEKWNPTLDKISERSVEASTVGSSNDPQPLSYSENEGPSTSYAKSNIEYLTASSLTNRREFSGSESNSMSETTSVQSLKNDASDLSPSQTSSGDAYKDSSAHLISDGNDPSHSRQTSDDAHKYSSTQSLKSDESDPSYSKSLSDDAHKDSSTHSLKSCASDLSHNQSSNDDVHKGPNDQSLARKDADDFQRNLSTVRNDEDETSIKQTRL